MMQSVRIVVTLRNKEIYIYQNETSISITSCSDESDWVVVDVNDKGSLRVLGKGWKGENP